MIDTRIFIPPSLCGCGVRITANWANKALYQNGQIISYFHPEPFTINSIDIESVCAAHESYKNELPSDPYWDLHTEPVGWTSAGYMCVGDTCVHLSKYGKIPKHTNPKPLNQLSEAEKLYLNLWRFDAKKLTLRGSCDCSAGLYVSKENQSETYVNHPAYSYKCKFHLNDDVQCTQAKDEFIALKHKKEQLLQVPEITESVVDFGGRKIVIDDTNRSLLTMFGIPEDEVLQKLKDSVIVEYDDNRNLIVKGVPENLDLSNIR